MKRIFSLLTALALVLSLGVFLPGGKTTVADVLFIQQKIAGWEV